MSEQLDAPMQIWQSTCPPYLWNLIRLAAQPLFPPAQHGQHDDHVWRWRVATSAPNQPTREWPVGFGKARDRNKYVMARKREIACARSQLISLYRAGVRHPYLTAEIDLMLHAALLADNPGAAFIRLLSPKHEGRPPSDDEANEFELAVEAERVIRQGVASTKAYASVASEWRARDPQGAKTASTVQRYHESHELAAKAHLSFEQVRPEADLDQALKTFFS